MRYRLVNGIRIMNILKPDLLLIDEFVPNHIKLFEALKTSVSWDKSMAARHTASFGEPYNYSQMTYPAIPMHPLLKPLVGMLHDKLQIYFNNCLLNYYQSGNSTMGFHSDDTSQLEAGTGVAIISLGNSRDITYRHKENHDIRHSFMLVSGSLLYMDSTVQDDWMHGIRKQPHTASRISLTWRAFTKAS